MENEHTLHNFIVLAIFLPKIIKFGDNLTKVWQKQFWLFFWDTVYCALNTRIQYIPNRDEMYTYYMHKRTKELTFRCHLGQTCHTDHIMSSSRVDWHGPVRSQKNTKHLSTFRAKYRMFYYHKFAKKAIVKIPRTSSSFCFVAKVF